MIVTWVFGIVLVLRGHWLRRRWFHAKFALVLAMTVMHGLLSHWVREFAADRNRASAEILSYCQ